MMEMTDSQISSMADIVKDIAQVVLAGVVIDPLMRREIDLLFLLPGMMLCLGLWYVNVLVVRNLKR